MLHYFVLPHCTICRSNLARFTTEDIFFKLLEEHHEPNVGKILNIRLGRKVNQPRQLTTQNGEFVQQNGFYSKDPIF